MAVTQVGPEHVKLSIKAKGAVGAAIVVACGTTWNLSESRAAQSVRCLGQTNDADNPEYGSYSATATLGGTYRFYTAPDAATNMGLQQLRAWMRSKTIVTVSEAIDVTDGTSETFDAIITGVNEDASGDANGTYTVNFAVRDIPVTAPIED